MRSFFVVFYVLFSCMGLISCKESNPTRTEKINFHESDQSQVAEDSVEIQNQYIMSINVGDEKERGAWQNPDLVVKKLGNLEGKTVADIGSGTGYFTFPISRHAKKVLAIDIEQRYLDYIEDRKLELPIQQADVIETRLTVADEPNLHSGEVDAVLLVNVYYYLSKRVDYMRIVKNALKKGGVLVLVDYRPGEMPVGPSENKVPHTEVVEVLRKAGFRYIEIDEESLQYQYIISAK